MINARGFDFSSLPSSETRPRFHYRAADTAFEPCVSIITPFYDVGPEFYETARTVQGQSLQQLEWIIVNDGSTHPRSLQILEEFRDSDPRIRVIDHETNKGLSAARNSGFRSARADRCILLDSDDLLEATAAEKWFWFLETHPQFAFVGGLSVGFGARNYLWHHGFQDGEANLTVNYVDHTTMIRTEAFSTVGGFDETILGGLEDWEFWIRSSANGLWGANIFEYLSWYRTRDSHTDRWENLQHSKIEEVKETFRHRYPQLWTGEFPQLSIFDSSPFRVPSDELLEINRLEKAGKRLLLVLPWLVMGGADKFNLDLTDQLTSLGWEITLATTLPSDNPWLPKFSRLTPDIFILSNYLPPRDYPRFLHYLIRSRYPDVVMFSSSEFGYQVLPYLRSRFPEIPFVDFCHSTAPGWLDGGYPRLATKYQDLVDLNLVASEQVGAWMEAEGSEPDKIRVSYIGVDAFFWSPDEEIRTMVRRDLGVKEETPIILYVARLDEGKRPEIFIQVMQELLQEGMNFQAYVIGEGPRLDWLSAQCETAGLRGKVELLGAMETEAVRDLMRGADILFLPSAWEGIALVLYEALATGIPVVASDVGGQRELVNDNCGILVPRSDDLHETKDFTEALKGLIQDRGLRTRMGAAGRERIIERFHSEDMGQRIQGLMEEAIRLHKARPTRAVSKDEASYAARSSVILAARDALAYHSPPVATRSPASLHTAPQYLFIFFKLFLSSLTHSISSRIPGFRRLSRPRRRTFSWIPATDNPALPDNLNSADVAFYFTLRAAFLPTYSRLSRRLPWLVPVKERIKKALTS